MSEAAEQERRASLRRPPLPHWGSPAGVCWWCGRPGAPRASGGSEYAQVDGWWHEECLTAYAIAVSSKAQRYFVERRDFGLCAGCGANAELAMWRAMLDDPTPPFFGWELGGTTTRHVDRECRCVANLSWFRPVKPPAPAAPWVEWHADHISPLWSVNRSLPWEAIQIFWSLDNLQTLCTTCHAKKTAREARGRAEIRRVDPRQGLLIPAHRAT